MAGWRRRRQECALLLAAVSFVAPISAIAQPALPHAVTNNAVAGGEIGGRWWIFSALGVDSSKAWYGITRAAWRWTPGMTDWEAMPEVPGRAGRLAATAQVVRGRLYVFGGYTVDSLGGERSVDVVDILDLSAGKWSSGAPMPVAVDDAVSGVWRDSLVYLVSGWHDTDNVRDVQVYDVVENRWHAATPIVGPGVFGHTGALARNTLLYIDGAAKAPRGPKYALVPQVWRGDIDPMHPTSIRWRSLGSRHPGVPRYRAAAAACGNRIVIAGGTSNPYNYNGVGYNGRPSDPLAEVVVYDVVSGRWKVGRRAPLATMDHRGLLLRKDTAVVVGGMTHKQHVIPAMTSWSLGECSTVR